MITCLITGQPFPRGFRTFAISKIFINHVRIASLGGEISQVLVISWGRGPICVARPRLLRFFRNTQPLSTALTHTELTCGQGLTPGPRPFARSVPAYPYTLAASSALALHQSLARRLSQGGQGESLAPPYTRENVSLKETEWTTLPTAWPFVAASPNHLCVRVRTTQGLQS